MTFGHHWVKFAVNKKGPRNRVIEFLPDEITNLNQNVTESAEFRFYAELNDFLDPGRRQKTFTYIFNGSPSIKDAIKAIGVPHATVDIILVKR